MNVTQLATSIAASYQPPDTGRPSAIGDPETLREFLTAIEAGNYLDTSCDLAGISRETYRQWTKRAEAGEAPYTTLVGAVKRASSRAEALAVQRVRQAGEDPRFWAAEMTYLERRHPEKWGRRSEANSGPAVQVYVGGVDIKDVRIAVVNPPQLPETFAPSESLSPSTFARESLPDGVCK
jgi:hypothetical protein